MCFLLFLHRLLIKYGIYILGCNLQLFLLVADFLNHGFMLFDQLLQHRQPGWQKEYRQRAVQWPDQPEPQERFRKPASVPWEEGICRQTDDKEAALSDPAA